MPKETWIIAGILTVAALLSLLGLASCHQGQELEQARVEAAESRAAAAKTEAEAGALKLQLAEAHTQIEDLQKAQEAATQKHQGLEDEMRSALESKDVTISQLQGKLTVNILDRVLFDSGEAELKPDGAAVLQKVAAIILQHPELKLHVIGHTDNVPIKATAKSRFPSNWELSTARATAAVRFLTETGGVDPKRLGVLGYGEFRPVADNSTPEGRARNRRIAITILSDELAGADTTSAPTPSTPSTNSPPSSQP